MSQNTEKDATASDVEAIVNCTVWTNLVDSFVAKDKEQLEKVFKEHYGYTMYEVTGDENELKWWSKAPPNGTTSIYMNLDDEDISDLQTMKVQASINPPMADWTHLVTAKNKHWAEWKKEGFLCSTEY